MLSTKFSVALRTPAISRSQKRTYCICPPKPSITVTVAGATSPVGQIIALLLKQCPYINELRLFDDGKHCCGLGIDLAHIDTNPIVKAYSGWNMLRAAVQGASIVVCCGTPISPGEPERCMFRRNADEVRNLAMHMAEFNPHGILCVGTPPVNAMVPMVYEEYKKSGKVDYRRIIGVTTLSVIRANSLVAEYLNVDATKVMVAVIGGSCANSCVSVLSQAKPSPIPSSVADELQAKIANADALVLGQKCVKARGTMYTSPAFAMARFVRSVSRALLGESNCVECAYIRQTGHIGKFLPYMASIVKLGKEGVESSHMPRISDSECDRLIKAAEHIRKSILLGKSFVLGEQQSVFGRCESDPCDVILNDPKFQPKEDTTDVSRKCREKV